MGELYRLDFADGKSYIGATKHPAVKRFRDHTLAAKSSKKGIIYDAWRQQGAPVLVVLAIVENADLAMLEEKAVNIFQTKFPNGYNFVDGGKKAPSLDAKVAEKIANALRGRKVVRTDEQRRQHVERMRNQVFSEETKRKMSLALKGRVFTSEHKEKLALAKRGRILPEETKVKMRAAQRARRKAEGCVQKEEAKNA